MAPSIWKTLRCEYFSEGIRTMPSNPTTPAQDRCFAGTVGRFQSFRDNQRTDGGTLRSAQLAEMLARAGIQTVDVGSSSLPGFSMKIYGAGIGLALRERLPGLLSRARLWQYGSKACSLDRWMAENPNVRVTLWERTQQPLLPCLAAAKGLKVIAIPHNLESLVPDRVDRLTGKGLPQSLNLEIEYLRRMTSVFVISREEQWLLEAFGVKAQYLPYFPPAVQLQWLLNVRKVRESTARSSRFLLLGSITNTPTRQGVTELLRYIQSQPAMANIGLDVVGNGTESLESEIRTAGIRLHGKLSDNTLSGLLSTASAALVFQRFGAGALTRIPEMLIAGVPVICNAVGGRSMLHFSGVHCFESWSEMFELMKSKLEMPPVPEAPERQEKAFITAIRSAAGWQNKRTPVAGAEDEQLKVRYETVDLRS